MKKHSYIAIFLFMLSHLTLAQHIPHLNAWSRFSITQPISEKWRAETEFQHRRQNDYAEKSGDLFQENLLSSVRTWVHYQHKEDIGFAISPFAYYWHNPIIVTDSDKLRPQVQELRFSLAVDLKHELLKKLWLIDRTVIEYRDFQKINENIVRLRNRLGVRCEFNSKWNVTLFDEIFLNIMGAKPSHTFDHDRIAILLNYKPTKNIRIETGYMYISRLPRNTNEFLHENNFLLHLYYTLPHSTNHHHTKHQKNS
jgi:Protein of unknown function (DUF2490)